MSVVTPRFVKIAISGYDTVYGLTSEGDVYQWSERQSVWVHLVNKA